MNGLTRRLIVGVVLVAALLGIASQGAAAPSCPNPDVIRWTGDTRADYGAYHGPAGTEASRIQTITNDLPPDPRWLSAMRMTLIDGDRSQWIPSEAGRNERMQLQGPAVFPIGQFRWLDFTAKIEQIAPGPRDWHLLAQLHSSGSQVAAPLNLAVDGNTSTMIRHTPTGFNHRYVGFRPIALGQHIRYRIGVLLTTSGNGRIVYYRDNELVATVTNVRTSEDGTANYPVIGFYRPASVTGTDRMVIAGMQVSDDQPPDCTDGPPPTNQAPTVADLTWTPAAPQAGQSVTFARAASDPDGDALVTTWDLDGDGQHDDATGDTVTRTYAIPGVYDVSVQVTDPSGAFEARREEITVTDAPPPPPGPPSQAVTAPSSSATYTDFLPYDVLLRNVPAGWRLYVGVASGPKAHPAGGFVTPSIGAEGLAYEGAMNIEALAPGTRWFYSALHRPDGSRALNYSAPFRVG